MKDRWTTLGALARTLALGALAILLFSAPAQAQLGAAVPNWTPPALDPAAAVQSGMHTMTVSNDVTSPIAFVGVTPCRVVDTRQAAGPFGGPHISPGSPRSFVIPSGPCSGIPVNAQAYSLNITATNTTATGFVKVFPEGGSSPVVSTLNFVAGVTIANAAIVAAGSGGGITVAASATTDILVDINGYYGNTPNNQQNYFAIYTTSPGYAGFFDNRSTSCNDACGIFVDAEGGDAVWGEADGTTGKTYGVYGVSASSLSGSAGVFGVDASGATDDVTGGVTAGVRGESRTFLGVLGVGEDASYGGVDGILTDSTGSTIQEGRLAVTTYGVYSFGDIGAVGTKFFVEPHPSDASKVIRYISLEGRESGTYFRGSAQFVNGQAVINVPEDFRMVTDSEGLTVQLTAVGAPANMYVVSEDLNQIVLASDRNVTFHYMVNGVRKSVQGYQPISDGQEFMPRSASEKMAAYLTPETKSRLIANGTYNADGTVNMTTAERLGWTKIWADRDAAIQAAAAKAQAAPRKGPSGQ